MHRNIQGSFSNAWTEYEQPEQRRGNASREEVAFKVAWSAVKKTYHKDEESGKWMKKSS